MNQLQLIRADIVQNHILISIKVESKILQGTIQPKHLYSFSLVQPYSLKQLHSLLLTKNLSILKYRRPNQLFITLAVHSVSKKEINITVIMKDNTVNQSQQFPHYNVLSDFQSQIETINMNLRKFKQSLTQLKQATYRIIRKQKQCQEKIEDNQQKLNFSFESLNTKIEILHKQLKHIQNLQSGQPKNFHSYDQSESILINRQQKQEQQCSSISSFINQTLRD